MLLLSERQINHSLELVDPGLRKYLAIQSKFDQVDVSSDREFQRKFNHFYRVRRNQEWQRSFYTLMQQVRHSDSPDFRCALTELFALTGKYEASFISKLIATIDTEKAVIDKFVLENVGLKLPPSSTKKRVDGIVATYDKLNSLFESYKSTPNGGYLIARFEERFGKNLVSTTKMIDLVLWQAR